MLHLDHVIRVVEDAEAAAAVLWEEHGLASVAGGRHPAWGTENRIVPLGDAYLELMTIFDAERAAHTELGLAVASRMARGGGYVGWMVHADDGAQFDALVAANRLEAGRFSRRRPDGTELGWRLAGLEAMLAAPPLPGLLDWDDPAAFPGLAAVEHRVTPRGLAWIEVAGDNERLHDWLGGEGLPLRFVDGEPGVHAAAVALGGGGGGEIVLR